MKPIKHRHAITVAHFPPALPLSWSSSMLGFAFSCMQSKQMKRFRHLMFACRCKALKSVESSSTHNAYLGKGDPTRCYRSRLVIASVTIFFYIFFRFENTNKMSNTIDPKEGGTQPFFSVGETSNGNRRNHLRRV
jgi:hypothetical protein